MKIVIVGPEESKWKPEQKEDAKQWITEFLGGIQLETIQGSLGGEELILISGHCPKGGVDIWSKEIADKLGIKKEIYPAEIEQWEDYWIRQDEQTIYQITHNITLLKGYKSRNIQIAESLKLVEDKLYCIVPNRSGQVVNVSDTRKYDRDIYCIHCKTFGHPTNGGCWTMKYAKKLGKETHLVVIE